MLVQLLNRSNEELLILVISFLKKLSLYAENKVRLPQEALPSCRE
jgi:hypothetical protein